MIQDPPLESTYHGLDSISNTEKQERGNAAWWYQPSGECTTCVLAEHQQGIGGGQAVELHTK